MRGDEKLGLCEGSESETLPESSEAALPDTAGHLAYVLGVSMS